jgi:hypothetical protein
MRREQGRAGRDLATIATTVLLFGVLCLVETGAGKPRHRFHAPSEGDRPQAVGPVTGAWQVTTRQWPFVHVIADPLPHGLYHAVTANEVAAMIDDLPEEWRGTIHSVRLCYRPDGEVMAETDGEAIELHYVVDRDDRAPVAPGEDMEEEQRFGGIPVQHGDMRWVRWPRRDLLRTYVLKHLFIHEVGHHLAPPDLDEDADEQWAESFAFRFYDPGGRQ